MPEDLNQKVAHAARMQFGHRVGHGECWDLADRALRDAGASSSTTTGKNDDYVWGDPVALQAVAPGDVLQFRNYVVTTKTRTDVTFDNGSGYVKDEVIDAIRGHHTAIVEAVVPGALLVLEQHVKPLGPKVQRHTIPIVPSPPVNTTTHRMMKQPSGGSLKPATVLTTVTIMIRGTVWAYRPKVATPRK
jgi:hypothetical protein